MKTENDSNQLAISYLSLRRAIGWLGILLPFMLVIGNFTINRLNLLNNGFFIDTACSGPYQAAGSFKSSISHYYYSSVGELFTGILTAVALFLFSYKGHPLRKGEKGFSDHLLSTLSGLFALGIVLFPTSADACIQDNIRSFLSSRNTGYIHFTMASLFFISLSVMSIVNFRRTADRASFGKMKNHNTYLFCGIAMLGCLVLIFIYVNWVESTLPWLDKIKPVFWLEALALLFFGVSWLKKGNVDFNYFPRKLKQMISN